MVERIDFPLSEHCYMVANFVQTLDGKVQGPGADYWPIGSPADLEMLLRIRAHCDAVLHGRQTALGHGHLERLASNEFQKLLNEVGQAVPYRYVVVSAHPDVTLLQHIAPGNKPVRVILATTIEAEVPSTSGVEVWRVGAEAVDLVMLRARLYEEGIKRCALEAGPQLFGAFVEAKLVDELWLTVAPKLFGTALGAPSMIGGRIFKADEVPQLALASAHPVGDELFLRYRFKEVWA